LEKIWRSREENFQQSVGASGLSESDYPPLILRLLLSRGLNDPDQVRKLLSPKLAELKDPFTMIDIGRAVERLVRAFRDQEKVCIYADFDLDGTSGLALLQDGFRQLGFQNLVWAQPKRLSEGYGFHAHIVEDLKAQGVSVIVTVDVGITAFQACQRASELGMDVVITDHHQPAESLPIALSVVNPNRRDDGSGLGFLCGAGVAFYLLRALKRGLVQAGLISESTLDLRSVLDCFCIGTLTDMVPLVEDNRALVKQGLLCLEKTQRPGLRALLEALDLSGRTLTSQDVAIRFAPKLNALSRMEMGILPIDLFLVEDKSRAVEMVKTVLANNSTRVQLQGAGESEAFDRLKDWPHPDFAFLSSPNFHRGVVGLIATKISLARNVPAFVGSVNSEGIVTGSGRLPSGHGGSLLRVLEAAKDHLLRFGGHDAAAGFEYRVEDEPLILEKFVEFFEGQDSLAQAWLDYDVQANLSEVNENLMKWLEILGPFGQGFENPLLCFRRVQIQDLIVLKGNHLKFKLQAEAGDQRLDAIYFSPPPKILEDLPNKGSSLDILGEVQWNYFSGRRTVQVLIKDFKKSV
jgi:single-stranded-DNA-specific exonuclease